MIENSVAKSTTFIIFQKNSAAAERRPQSRAFEHGGSRVDRPKESTIRSGSFGSMSNPPAEFTFVAACLTQLLSRQLL